MFNVKLSIELFDLFFESTHVSKHIFSENFLLLDGNEKQ